MQVSVHTLYAEDFLDQFYKETRLIIYYIINRVAGFTFGRIELIPDEGVERPLFFGKWITSRYRKK